MIHHGVEVADEFSRKVEEIANCVLKYLNVREGELNIVLTNDENIRKLNRQFRNIDGPTDVLSFAYDEGELLGEIVISLETVKHQSEAYGNDFHEEFEFVLVHGILHILGYDHESDEDAKAMFELQDILLKECRGEG